MIRTTLAAALILSATAATAQDAADPGTEGGGINAAEYIRGVLENQRRTDPYRFEREYRDNGIADRSGSHFNPTIFEGRRRNATRGTGLRLVPQIDLGGTE